MTGGLTFAQVKHLITLAAELASAARAEGQAIDGPGGTWQRTHGESGEALRALVDAIGDLQSGVAPEGASCEQCGSTTAFLWREPGTGDAAHPETEVLCRACLALDTRGGAS